MTEWTSKEYPKLECLVCGYLCSPMAWEYGTMCHGWFRDDGDGPYCLKCRDKPLPSPTLETCEYLYLDIRNTDWFGYECSYVRAYRQGLALDIINAIEERDWDSAVFIDAFYTEFEKADKPGVKDFVVEVLHCGGARNAGV
jgi:hypothetical protein